ncbi:MAG: ATP-grasp domain-containing protein [Clostridiales bacterium]|nr:ATP-grasp domain-containing protein [Clostridiales bacterium]
MNFIFISPQFPKTYWNFCDRLKKNGVNVLGIADTPYEELDDRLKNSLTEYYRVYSLENYDEVYRAVAFFAFKYGKIDWLESNNEYWLEQDARLRTDFNITTGVQADQIWTFKSKFAMKEFYAKAGVPSAKCHRVTTLEEGLNFINQVGYPVIVKPDNGVGASDTHKLHNRDEVERFYRSKPSIQYVMEEFINGNIYSYDAITNQNGDPLFETMTAWPPSIMDIVNDGTDLAYYVGNDIPDVLRDMGRRTVKAFQARNRFVHMEFFRLTEAKAGIGEVGDFVGLEVNMRPAGGYTPDMFNYAGSLDVYQIWADMVAKQHSDVDQNQRKYFCVYAGRRDGKRYRHSDEEVMRVYGSRIVMKERIPGILSGAMGNQMYTAKVDSKQDVDDFIRFVQEQV